MSLNLEWGPVADAAPTYALAVGLKHGTQGFNMRLPDGFAREQTEASLHTALCKLAPFLREAQMCIDSASDGFGRAMDYYALDLTPS